MLGRDSVYDPILAESAEIHAIVEDFLSFCQAAARRRQRARPASEIGLPAATELVNESETLFRYG